MDSAGLTIAGVARAAGVGVETVRYYERRGLIRQPTRRVGAYRRYEPDHVKRMRFVKRAQELGFTLEEVATLLQLEDGTNRTMIQEIASVRLAQIRDRLRTLRRMEGALSHLLDHCKGGRTIRCPIIDAIGSTETRNAAGLAHTAMRQTITRESDDEREHGEPHDSTRETGKRKRRHEGEVRGNRKNRAQR